MTEQRIEAHLYFSGVEANWYETEPMEAVPCIRCGSPATERFSFIATGHKELDDDFDVPCCTGCGVGVVMQAGKARQRELRKPVQAVR